MLKPLSVKQFNQYVKTNFKHDPIFMNVSINGALANIRKSHSHLYFSLKEESDVIDCVIYYYDDKDIDFDFTQGTDVVVKGNLSYNNYSSRIVVITKDIEKKGVSEEYLKFIKLKESLYKKGYFDEENKKEIPAYPKNIGLITSKDGAALVDFVSVIDQKPNDINIKLYPVKVQGDLSVGQVTNAIKSLDKMGLDAIVITRGGGSSEDLAVFNDEAIVRKVYEASTPIISAIGHKIDSTLLDLVADLSLQTPTEAGSFIIANYSNIQKDLDKIIRQMDDIVTNQYRINELKLNLVGKTLKTYNPIRQIESKEKDIKSLKKDLDKTILSNFSYNKDKLSLLKSRLISSKKLIDIRKESIGISKLNGDPIFSKHSLKDGDEIEISFSDGKIRAVVKDG